MQIADPFARWTVKQVAPKDWGAAIDYDQGIWRHPYMGNIVAPSKITDWRGYCIHYWGGPTLGGSVGDPDPGWTARERLNYYLGRAAATARSGEAFHIRPVAQGGRGWRGLAYCGVISPHSGDLMRGRGFRYNGGQLGAEWNEHWIAISFASGETQTPSNGAFMTLARMWLEVPGPIIGHKDTNYPTACPGTAIYNWIKSEGWITTLGTMRYRRVAPTRGGRVLSLTARLRDLGYLGRTYGTYTLAVKKAVMAFQIEARITADGICGPETIRALGGAKVR